MVLREEQASGGCSMSLAFPGTLGLAEAVVEALSHRRKGRLRVTRRLDEASAAGKVVSSQGGQSREPRRAVELHVCHATFSSNAKSFSLKP